MTNPKGNKESLPPGGKPAGLQAARRHKVGILYLKGFSVRDIAGLIQRDIELVGAEKTSYVTVHKDIKAIKNDLLKANLDALEVQKARSIAHLRLIQQRAWTEIAPAKQSSSVRAQLLNVITVTEDKIAKLEGTYAPTEITGKGGKPLVPKAPFNLLLPEGGIFSPDGDGNGQKDEAVPEA